MTSSADRDVSRRSTRRTASSWLGAGALAVFTLLTIPLVHHFWSMPEPKATQAFHTATEHITVVGALMLVAILSRYTGGAGNGPKRT